MSLIPPTKNTELIINDFILYATGHLATVGGIINTTSLFPAAPSPIPGPGVILWTGYQIPPAKPPIPKLDTTPVIMNEQQLVISTLSSLDGVPINEATTFAFDTDLDVNPPSLSLEEVNTLFIESLSTESIPDPTDEELEAERQNLSSEVTSTNNSEAPADTQPEDDNRELTEEEKALLAQADASLGNINNPPQVNPEQVPNYNTTIKVPDDVILAMRRWGVGVNNAKERAHFLAQCSHESGAFRLKVENLNYSASGLLNTFSKYFKTQALADSYARQPEKIASKVYGDRMGNGNEASKEGYKFRGRGYIQLTGKSNYTKMNLVVKTDDIVTNPNLVETKYPGDSACYFWTANNLKSYVTNDDETSVKSLTKRINGGENGLADRKKKFLVYWGELKKDPTLWS